MNLLVIALVIVVPYCIGSALILILGERTTIGPIRWVVGVLSVFACFLLSLLVVLKTDGNLASLQRIFGIILASVSVGSIPVIVYGIKKKELRPTRYRKGMLTWMIPALFLGAFAVFFLAPDFTNDITVETIMTTLATGEIYTKSALLGTTMEAGLPIFNKIEIIPMLYAVVCKTFNIDVFLLISVIAPIATYVVNMFMMWEISAFLVKEKHRNLFMIFHLLVIIAGTNLPTIAFPTTLGEPLLLQGYSGFAWAYGVLLPAVILTLLQKRYVLAGVLFVPIVGLIRIDRIFFLAKDFLTSYKSINTANKLFLLYIVAVIWWILRLRKKKKLPAAAFFSASTMIGTTLVDAFEYIGEKKAFVVSMSLIILATTGFTPFKDGTLYLSQPEYVLERFVQSDKATVVWAPEYMLTQARREDTNICPIYGRDLYNNYLQGVNYEPYTQEHRDLLRAMEVCDMYNEPLDDVDDIVRPVLQNNFLLEKVDVIILPSRTISSGIKKDLLERGFSIQKEMGGYLKATRFRARN